MTQIPEEAIAVGARMLKGQRGQPCDSESLREHFSEIVLIAAYPVIEKQIRAEIAGEIRKKRDQVDPRKRDQLPSDHHAIGRVAAYERAARIAEGGNHA